MNPWSLLFLTFFALPYDALALGCRGGDVLEGVSQRIDQVACRAAGHCHAYGWNPATGRYENYYGYHSSCAGTQQKTVTIYHCFNSLGVGYTVENHGPWESCRIH